MLIATWRNKNIQAVTTTGMASLFIIIIIIANTLIIITIIAIVIIIISIIAIVVILIINYSYD